MTDMMTNQFAKQRFEMECLDVFNEGELSALIALDDVALADRLFSAHHNWSWGDSRDGIVVKSDGNGATSKSGFAEIKPMYIFAAIAVRCYANLSRSARVFREQGQISKAQEYEAEAQRYYYQLPAFARW